MNLSPKQTTEVCLRLGSDTDKALVEKYTAMLKPLAKIEEITYLDDSQTPPPSATALCGELEILIPLKGLIDKEAEIARLNKTLGKMENELSKAQAKLSNPKFIDNAPQSILDGQKQKVIELESATKTLKDKLAVLKKL